MFRTLSIALALLLGGCALSPQQIRIEPQVDTDSTNIGSNQAVAVSVTNAQSEPALGTRGGVYSDTALIRPSNDLQAAIRKTVRSGLQQQGFNAYNPGQPATDLEVRLIQLNYVPEAGSVVNHVTVRAKVQAIAKHDGTTHQATYRSKLDHDSPFTPGADRNRELLTEVLENSLQRMLTDGELLDFLKGQAPPTDTDEANKQAPDNDA